MTARSTRVLLMSAAFLAGLVLCFGIVLIVTGRLSAPVAQQVAAAAIGGPFKLIDQNDAEAEHEPREKCRAHQQDTGAARGHLDSSARPTSLHKQAAIPATIIS